MPQGVEDVVARLGAPLVALARLDHHHALLELKAVLAGELNGLGDGVLGRAASSVRALAAVFGRVDF